MSTSIFKFPENKKKELIIPAQWKRKHKIIIRANYSGDITANKDIESILVNTMWKMWVFN